MNHPIYAGLRNALDNLTNSERKILVVLAHEYEGDGMLGVLLDGLVDQLLREDAIEKAHEQATLAAIEDDWRRELDEIERRVHGEHPPVEGRAADVDPDTGKVIEP